MTVSGVLLLSLVLSKHLVDGWSPQSESLFPLDLGETLVRFRSASARELFEMHEEWSMWVGCWMTSSESSILDKISIVIVESVKVKIANSLILHRSSKRNGRNDVSASQEAGLEEYLVFHWTIISPEVYCN